MEIAYWKDSKFEKMNSMNTLTHLNGSISLQILILLLMMIGFADLIVIVLKTADDFFTKQVPNPSMLQRSSNVSAVDYQNQSSISNTPGKKRKTPMNKRWFSSYKLMDSWLPPLMILLLCLGA